MGEQIWHFWDLQRTVLVGEALCVGRFVGHLMGNAWFLHLVYVDDLHGKEKFANLWIWILAFELVGTPFAYHKFRGGFSSEFVGYQLREVCGGDSRLL